MAKKRKSKKPTYESLLAEVRELRLIREQADAKMLLRIYQIEQNHMDILNDAGCDTIEQWIKSEHLADPAKYSRFRRGIALVGENEALKIGAAATMEAASLHGPPEPYVIAVQNWSTMHEGMKPSSEMSRKLLRQVDVRPEIPKSTKQVSRIAELEAQVQQLKAENRSLRRKVAKMEKKLGKENKAA